MTPARLLNLAFLSAAFLALAAGIFTPTPGRAASQSPATRPASTQPAQDSPLGAQVKVARFIQGNSREDVCFADGFLATVAQETRANVARRFSFVNLDSPDIYEYPFAVLTGNKPFKLTDPERKNLKAYLSGKGFLLASASCSTKEWADSFRAELAAALPDAVLTPLSLDHRLFHSLFEIDRVVATKDAGGAPIIYSIQLGGRLVGIFSPLGLNDTANAGGTCCCCGGNEIRQAKLINANALVEALMP